MVPRCAATARTGTAGSRDKDANKITAATIATVAAIQRCRDKKLALLLVIVPVNWQNS
jgi:hypothetical protein